MAELRVQCSRLPSRLSPLFLSPSFSSTSPSLPLHRRSSSDPLLPPESSISLSFTTELGVGSPISRPHVVTEAIAHDSRRLCVPYISDNTLPYQEVLKIVRSADAVCFDVDSTVCIDEGIDELANFCGAGEAVAELTKRAMGGSVSLQEALSARLNIFKPSLAQLNDFLSKRPPRLSPGIPEVVKKLKDMKVDVYLVSGGFRQMIKPVAAFLGIPPENIYANQLLFGSAGEFAGFDPEEPTSKTGGKAVAVEMIKKIQGYKVVVMVGDGATDLEARREGSADLFICYGGAQLRQNVAGRADWLIFNFDDLLEALRFSN
ncbi:phosphoserine phosphatase, chloroplastic-like [Nymphaea colorata]|nr:phosphoserine phosphatase, chloroplastic-like [Nymphaea colorata]